MLAALTLPPHMGAWIFGLSIAYLFLCAVVAIADQRRKVQQYVEITNWRYACAIAGQEIEVSEWEVDQALQWLEESLAKQEEC